VEKEIQMEQMNTDLFSPQMIHTAFSACTSFATRGSINYAARVALAKFSYLNIILHSQHTDSEIGASERHYQPFLCQILSLLYRRPIGRLFSMISSIYFTGLITPDT